MNKHTGFCSVCPMRRFGICASLVKSELEKSHSGHLHHFSIPAKHHLFRQGESNNGGYILRKGWILLSRMSKDGTRQVFRSILPGDFLGFQPDLNGPHIYSALALSDSEICTVPDLLEICSKHPDLALQLAWIGACDMTLTETYLVNIAHRSAREKVAFMALELFLRLQARDLNRGYTIQFPLLQEDLADSLGITTVHVNRTLKSLKKDGILKIEKQELTILDYKALYAMVGTQLEPLAACGISENGFEK